MSLLTDNGPDDDVPVSPAPSSTTSTSESSLPSASSSTSSESSIAPQDDAAQESAKMHVRHARQVQGPRGNRLHPLLVERRGTIKTLQCFSPVGKKVLPEFNKAYGALCDQWYEQHSQSTNPGKPGCQTTQWQWQELRSIKCLELGEIVFDFCRC